MQIYPLPSANKEENNCVKYYFKTKILKSASDHKYSHNRVIIKCCRDSKKCLNIEILLIVHELHDSRIYLNKSK